MYFECPVTCPARTSCAYTSRAPNLQRNYEVIERYRDRIYIFEGDLTHQKFDRQRFIEQISASYKAFLDGSVSLQSFVHVEPALTGFVCESTTDLP
ncbi:uncharacterized protein L969DRAFT_87923 [Mixia osmundae IAM 14324]|uniref:uncharacterized protein n=1 Tax=Mixia osmundae (strain CBS 9802 / IAM 14324 / JCM 22182 / KY 12970) TaxID=764103 RepID=UPI0004A547FF|nr:uncharacterized protein L969DRAFT_87923 [Mixia osmundae IAM 14324]KEI38691.1 hypothetical protein L969DRAFT_87923 [Mixia osmundae IAM 14324]